MIPAHPMFRLQLASHLLGSQRLDVIADPNGTGVAVVRVPALPLPQQLFSELPFTAYFPGRKPRRRR